MIDRRSAVGGREVGGRLLRSPTTMVRERIGELDLHAPRLIAVFSERDISGGSPTIDI